MKTREEIEKNSGIYALSFCTPEQCITYDMLCHNGECQWYRQHKSDFISGAEYILKAIEEEREAYKCNCE